MTAADAFAEWFQTMIGKKTTQTLEDLFETSTTETDETTEEEN